VIRHFTKEFPIIIRILLGILYSLFFIACMFFIISLVTLYGKIIIIKDYEEYFSHHIKSVVAYAIYFKNIYWLIANIVIVCFVGISSGISRSIRIFDDEFGTNILWGMMVGSLMFICLKIMEICYTNYQNNVSLVIAVVCSTILGIFTFIKIDMDFELPYHGKIGLTVFVVSITSLFIKVIEYSILNGRIIIGIIVAIIAIFFVFMLIAGSLT